MGRKTGYERVGLTDEEAEFERQRLARLMSDVHNGVDTTPAPPPPPSKDALTDHRPRHEQVAELHSPTPLPAHPVGRLRRWTSHALNFFSTLFFIAGSLTAYTKNVPVPLVKILAIGVGEVFYTLGFAFWRTAMALNPACRDSRFMKRCKEHNEHQVQANKYYKRSANFGLLFGTVAIITLLTTPVGWALAGLSLVAGLCYVASNLLWVKGAEAEIATYKATYDSTGKTSDLLKWRAAKEYYQFTMAATFASTILLLGAIAVLTFPPAAIPAALLITGAFAGPAVIKATWHLCKSAGLKIKSWWQGRKEAKQDALNQDRRVEAEMHGFESQVGKELTEGLDKVAPVPDQNDAANQEEQRRAEKRRLRAERRAAAKKHHRHGHSHKRRRKPRDEEPGLSESEASEAESDARGVQRVHGGAVLNLYLGDRDRRISRRRGRRVSDESSSDSDYSQVENASRVQASAPSDQPQYYQPAPVSSSQPQYYQPAAVPPYGEEGEAPHPPATNPSATTGGGSAYKPVYPGRRLY